VERGQSRCAPPTLFSIIASVLLTVVANLLLR
jgi:hypothetical protein